MKNVNEAYKRWEKERSEEAKAAWYEAVRRFSKGLKKFHEVHSYYTAIEHKRSGHRKSQTQA